MGTQERDSGHSLTNAKEAASNMITTSHNQEESTTLKPTESALSTKVTEVISSNKRFAHKAKPNLIKNKPTKEDSQIVTKEHEFVRDNDQNIAQERAAEHSLTNTKEAASNMITSSRNQEESTTLKPTESALSTKVPEVISSNKRFAHKAKPNLSQNKPKVSIENKTKDSLTKLNQI